MARMIKIRFDYSRVLLLPATPANWQLVAALEEQGRFHDDGYQSGTTVFKPTDNQDLEVSVENIEMEEEGGMELLRKQLEAAEKKYSEANSARWKTDRELTEAKTQLEALKEARSCPASQVEAKPEDDSN